MNNEEFAQKNTCCLKKVLVTGASGFIGSFLVEGGLEREMQVWAGVRKSSSRTYLKDPRIQFAELDFAHPGRLTEQLAVHKQLHGGWDYIIHCAGVTKCRHKDKFDKGNYVYTRNFVEALRTLDIVPRQFVYISSLSIFGPIHEDNYARISERDTAMPNTAYGVSSFITEHAAKRIAMDDAEVEEEQEQKKERILIPVANPDTLDKLMQLALVFAVALMVALVTRYNMTEMFSQEDFTMVKNPGKENMEIITKEGQKINRYTPSEDQDAKSGKKGRKVGIAYELDNGEIIYVPED